MIPSLTSPTTNPYDEVVQKTHGRIIEVLKSPSKQKSQTIKTILAEAFQEAATPNEDLIKAQDLYIVELEKSNTGLINKIDAIAEQNKILQTNFQQLDERTQEYEKQLSDLTQKHDKQSEEHDLLKKQTEQLGSEYQTLNEQYGIIETNYQELSTQKESLKKQSDALQKRCEKLSTQVAGLKQKGQTLKTHTEKISQRYESLKQKYQILNKDTIHLKTRFDDLSKETSNLQDLFNQSVKENAHFRSTIEQQGKQISTLEERVRPYDQLLHQAWGLLPSPIRLLIRFGYQWQQGQTLGYGGRG